ncbi:hypothetical protein [Actinopolyspora saharensis]|uniref:hypothetical protein n=1 Tax=Actinopolyspora saharensis TaxID=995062 RepID=UPI003F67E161
MVGVLVVAGCSGSGSEGPPGWVSSPPEYLSCDGFADPQLVVDLVRAADLVEPDPEEPSVKTDGKEPSVTCWPLMANQIILGSDPVSEHYLEDVFAPPDPLMVPISGAPGFVMHDYGRLYVPCTRGSGTVTLNSTISVDTAELRNPRARLAMARLLVDTTNRARARFGCAESALSLPTELPEIPEFGPGSGSGQRDDGDRAVLCDPGVLSSLPNYSPGWGRPWAMETPRPSSLLSTCEIRVGNQGRARGILPGTPKVAFVTYRGVLARARHESEKYSWPEYDISCHGEPVSYRMYVTDPDDSDSWLTELPDDPAYERMLDNFAGKAADRAGCPIS